MTTSLASEFGPMPERGAVSTRPASEWEWGMLTGNGIHGALLWGSPEAETVAVNHCRLFLPLGSWEHVPQLGPDLPQVRRLIREEGYDAAYQFMETQARLQGFPGMQWTDPYHLGFELLVRQPGCEKRTAYARTEDFQTGEITTRWTDSAGLWQRRLFVSRPDNTVVLSLLAPQPGLLTCLLEMAPLVHDLIAPVQAADRNGGTAHVTYVKGKGGYDAAFRVEVRGGTVTSNGQTISVANADEVLVLARIQPFGEGAGSEMSELPAALAALPADYTKLFTPHAEAHGALFNRVTLDLGGGTDRERTTDDLLLQAQQEQRLPPALLEKIYDAGRYLFLCDAGDRPPNLQGIWNGSWGGAWSSDYTTDTNLELAITSAYSGNLPEALHGYFDLVTESLPDWRTNAAHLYGCRGVLAPPRQSNNGLMIHWSAGWPMQFWTCGAGYMAHYCYDYYLYTGDRDFLARRVVPLLQDIALFYEDFLFADDSGQLRFSPSYSAEIHAADNATMDIAVAREVFSNLIAACREINTESDSLSKWEAMHDALPPYVVNADGALSEFTAEPTWDNYNHRHYSHLYPIWGSREFSPDGTPALWQAAKVALAKRLEHSTETASHGRMHAALTAVGLGEGDTAYGVLERMVFENKYYSSLATSHDADYHIFNVDAPGATPDILSSMICQSEIGYILLLPALPSVLPKGSIQGILARGQITVNRLDWDIVQGTVHLELTSGKDQTVQVRVHSQPQTHEVSLPAQQTVTLDFRLPATDFVPQGEH